MQKYMQSFIKHQKSCRNYVAFPDWGITDQPHIEFDLLDNFKFNNIIIFKHFIRHEKLSNFI